MLTEFRFLRILKSNFKKTTRCMLSVYLICFMLIPSGTVFAGKGIRAKPIDIGTGEPITPTPNFRNTLRRGELEVGTDGLPKSGGGASSYTGLGGSSGALGGSGSSDGASSIDMRYQVHVLGEVANPGTYRVLPSERMSEIIQRAGSIMETGSLRRIELRRANERTRSIDLYRFYSDGRLEDNPYVMDNDVIYIPLVNDMVQVVGAVRRPDYYELKDEKNLKEVLFLAGGTGTSLAFEQPIKVIRFEEGKKKIYDVSNNQQSLSEFEIVNGDIIFVPDIVTSASKLDYNVISVPGSQPSYPTYDDRVFVLGGVSRPGALSYSPYHTVNQYLSLAGGLSDFGTNNVKVISSTGQSRRVDFNTKVNPGDTILVKKRALRPIDWVGFGMSLASFGLSTTATVLALTRR